MQVAQGGRGITDDGLVRGGRDAGRRAGAGRRGDRRPRRATGTINAAVVAGVARQPGAQGKLTTASILGISLVESAYFINLAFMALFVFNLAR
jgi:F-type H+-transporting ATPase subunit c